MKGSPSPRVSAAEPRLPGDAREREAQQGASCGGEAPLTPDLHHPAAQEVLKTPCVFVEKPRRELCKVDCERAKWRVGTHTGGLTV